MGKKRYQFSRGVYVFERPGKAVLTNEVELGLVSPARISRYMKWVETGNMFRHRAGEMLIASCHGRGVVSKLTKWLESDNAVVKRAAAWGLMHQPQTERIHNIIATKLTTDPDSIVQYRLIQALARHGTVDEIALLKEYSKRPTPPSPSDLC